MEPQHIDTFLYSCEITEKKLHNKSEVSLTGDGCEDKMLTH